MGLNVMRFHSENTISKKNVRALIIGIAALIFIWSINFTNFVLFRIGNSVDLSLGASNGQIFLGISEGEIYSDLTSGINGHYWEGGPVVCYHRSSGELRGIEWGFLLYTENGRLVLAIPFYAFGILLLIGPIRSLLSTRSCDVTQQKVGVKGPSGQ